MKVLFVCSGNTCRSPLAAAAFRRLLDESGRNDIEVASAGTGAYHLELQTGGESWQGFLGLLGRSSIDREEAAEAAVATFAYARSAFATGAFAKDLHEQP